MQREAYKWAVNDVLHCGKSEVLLLETCTHTLTLAELSLYEHSRREGGLSVKMVCLFPCWANKCVCVCVYLQLRTAVFVSISVCSMIVCTSPAPAK